VAQALLPLRSPPSHHTGITDTNKLKSTKVMWPLVHDVHVTFLKNSSNGQKCIKGLKKYK